MTANKLIAIQTLFNRVARDYHKAAKPKITCPADVYRLMKPVISQDQHQEVFYILMLDVKNVVQDQILISKGTLNASLVHSRDVFRPVLRHGGIASICLVHSHPSGDTNP